MAISKKNIYLKSVWITWEGPKFDERCPYKNAAEGVRQMNGEDTETQRRRPCEDRGRDGVMLSQAKECWEHQKLKEVSSDSFSDPSEGEHLDFGLLASRAKRIKS